MSLGEVVISDLVVLHEPRAIPELRRLAEMEEGSPDRFGNTDGPIIELARAALQRLGQP